MKKIILPLALLASIATLTSCTEKNPTPVETNVVPLPTFVKTTPATPAPPVVPTEPATPTPADSGAVISTGSFQIGATPPPQSMAPITKTETVTYTTPAGVDPVEFSVTTTDGVINAVVVTPKSTHEISKKLQTAFAGEIGAKVVGKKISELSLSAVGGASLTTAAFNKFVQTF